MIPHLSVSFVCFFMKLYKRFYKTSSGRDEGTLQNLKILLQRSNVNGNVKSRFKVCISRVLVFQFLAHLSTKCSG